MVGGWLVVCKPILVISIKLKSRLLKVRIDKMKFTFGHPEIMT